MILSPKTEWNTVASEEPNNNQLIMGYLIPLTLIGAIAAFVGYGLIGVSVFGYKYVGMEWGIYHALVKLILGVLSVYITAFVLDALAPSFGSEKNMGRSLQLVVYGSTPSLVAAIFSIFPSIAGVISLIAAIYTIYVLYLGFGPVKKTPEDKKVIYMIVCIVVLIVVYFIIGAILGAILMPLFNLNYGLGL